MLTAAIIQAYNNRYLAQYEETRSFAFNVARSRYTIIIKNQLIMTDVVPSVIFPQKVTVTNLILYSIQKLWDKLNTTTVLPQVP